MRITEFNFEPGQLLSDKYQIISLLGKGWEGEVYQVREKRTGIERAAKFFYPHRNLQNQKLAWYAKKLHKLRSAPAIVQYQTQEVLEYAGQTIRFLISEYVSGQILTNFLKQQKRQRLSEFQALHLLYALVKGVESIHALREYHGDLHTGNVIVAKFGIDFELKFLDMFPRGRASKENMMIDLLDCIKICYAAIGGASVYQQSSPHIKYICSGLRASIIYKKFKSAHDLRAYIERLNILEM